MARKTSKHFLRQLEASLADIIVKNKEWGLERLTEELGVVARSHATLAHGSRFLEIESRRRVLELRLLLLCQRGEEFEIVERAYIESYRLGFSNLIQRSSADAAFASYCARNRNPSRARLVLRTLIGVIRRTRGKGRAALKAILVRDAESKLATLSKSN